MLSHDGCQKSYEGNQSQAATTKVEAFIVDHVYLIAR